jgi:hypothetical protein
MDRKYLLTALGYAILGLLLGIYMAKSKDHGQLVTHAHIMLVGFVVSFVYAVIYKLWLDVESNSLIKVQFLCHQVGTVGMLVGLFCLYGQILEEPVIGPVLGISSFLVLIGMVLMKTIYIKQTK